MFKILARVDDDLIVGTHKGRVGFISLAIMEDEGLSESHLLNVYEVIPGRTQWKVISAPQYNLWDLRVLADTIEAREEVIDLKLWHCGNFLLRVGYWAEKMTWLVSHLTEQEKVYWKMK